MLQISSSRGLHADANHLVLVPSQSTIDQPRKCNVQKAKSFDKRPKPKGQYHGSSKEDTKVRNSYSITPVYLTKYFLLNFGINRIS